jgi:hypothetical protein
LLEAVDGALGRGLKAAIGGILNRPGGSGNPGTSSQTFQEGHQIDTGAANEVPERQVRALFDTHTVTFYQAYPSEIADRALDAGTFVPPFKFDRMTWIKPSFLWMMYRSGWAMKPGQERILAVHISREGFEWALKHSVLTGCEASAYASRQEWTERKLTNPVRIQWDPERSLSLEPLPWRCIQIGLSAEAVQLYVQKWITGLTDITLTVREVCSLVEAERYEVAGTMLPRERPYTLPRELQRLIGAA